MNNTNQGRCFGRGHGLRAGLGMRDGSCRLSSGQERGRGAGGRFQSGSCPLGQSQRQNQLGCKEQGRAFELPEKRLQRRGRGE